MRKWFLTWFVSCLVIATVAVFTTGCTSTSKITATELDPVSGKPVKVTVTETKESVVEQVIASTQNKSVFIFREQYICGVRAEPSAENFFKLSAVYEHSNTGLASILPAHDTAEKLKAIATVMSVMKKTDSVSLGVQGIGSGSGSSSANSSGATGNSAADLSAAPK